MGLSGYSIGNGWTATEDGWVIAQIYSDAGKDGYIQINGRTTIQNWQGRGDGRAGGFRMVGICPISQGQRITRGSNGVESTWFARTLS